MHSQCRRARCARRNRGVYRDSGVSRHLPEPTDATVTNIPSPDLEEGHSVTSSPRGIEELAGGGVVLEARLEDHQLTRRSCGRRYCS
ncbi:conserved domain protein [Actinomyces sp. oral taxon 170 str. F0386]|nr:conserved domain protein [Actinomyces sp. oral taxon 170 str. F0386]